MVESNPARLPARARRTGLRILVATPGRLLAVDPADGELREAGGVAGRVSSLAVSGSSPDSPDSPDGAWCGTDDGVLRSDDGGGSWRRSGLEGLDVTAIAASPVRDGLIWAGTEPSAVWRSEDAGESWRRARGLNDLPSSSEWSFPPRPETHHVRWIACHPEDAGRLWVAIEAGALVSTPDGGESWRDRAPAGPYDTHELAVHPREPETLRSAAGDGYFESRDGGASWSSPEEGLEVGYLRSVAVDPGDPGTAVVSAASGPGSAYTAGGDGRLYRRRGGGRWERVTAGWPEPAATMAPLLAPGRSAGELWAADERGLHRSDDGGRSWELRVAFEPQPPRVDALALLGATCRTGH